MSEKRFTTSDPTIEYSKIVTIVWDSKKCKHLIVDEVVELLNEQQATIKQLEEDKAIAEDYANIFEMENVKLRKKLNTYKATILSFLWGMEQNGQINGKDDDFVKDLFKLIK